MPAIVKVRRVTILILTKDEYDSLDPKIQKSVIDPTQILVEDDSVFVESIQDIIATHIPYAKDYVKTALSSEIGRGILLAIKNSLKKAKFPFFLGYEIGVSVLGAIGGTINGAMKIGV